MTARRASEAASLKRGSDGASEAHSGGRSEVPLRTTHAQFHDRVIALAGAFQALALVQQVARTGQVDEPPFLTCLASVLAIDAPSTDAVYGGRDRLQLGLQAFARHLDGPNARDVELARYWLGVQVLERKLAKKRALLDAIAEGLVPLAAEAARVGPADDTVVAGLAALYRSSVSPMVPRILVSGEPRHLNEEHIADRIRALLLAAIRSAVLWRQVGGTRLGLLFSRRQLSAAVRELLDSIHERASEER
jgi:high frequency lysogenization protein